MDDNSPLGYTEVPPPSGSDRHNSSKEQKPYPPAERPVYAANKDDLAWRKSSSDGGGGGASVFINFFIGVAAVIVVGALLYAVVPMIKGKTSLTSQSLGSDLDLAVLRAEAVRTIALLDTLKAQYDGDEEKLKQINSLGAKARQILDTINGTDGSTPPDSQ